MLSQQQLRALWQEMAHERVLSVYIDGAFADPAVREGWRLTLAGALRDLHARTEGASTAERAELERCTALLSERLDVLREEPPVPAWVAFITARGVRHTAWLPAPVPTRIWWGEGPLVGPYLRALKEHRPVVVAIGSARAGRLYRYERGRLEHVDTISVEQRARGQAMHRVHGPGARGQTSDAARRARDEGLARMLRTLAERVTREAGEDAWVVIGGAPKAAALAARELPPSLAARTRVSPALPVRASARAIREEAALRASELRRARDLARLDAVAEAWGADERGAMGLDATLRALAEGSVEELLISPRLLSQHADDAERATRAALGQDALIEVVSGEPADRLDALAGGIAARLRFAPVGTAVA